MFKRRTSLAALILLFVTFGLNGVAGVKEIVVANSGFELPAQWDGSFSVGVISGWTISQGAVAGVQNPVDAMFSGTTEPLQGMPDGKQCAWLNTVGTISQELSETLQPDTEYVLSVMVGDRRDDAVGVHSVELHAGVNLLGKASPATVDGGFVTAIVKYSAHQDDPFLGLPLKIVLAKAATVSGQQANFDRVVFTSRTAVPPTPVNGLVGHWRLDESSGLVAHDTQVWYDGVLSPTGAEFDASGVSGNALRLDRNQNGFMVVTNLTGLVTNDFTLLAWMKVSPGDTASDTVLLSFYEPGINNGFFLQLNEGGGLGAPGKVTLVMNDQSHSVTSTSSITDGKWHQVVVAYAKGGQTDLYVDGSPAQGSVLTPAIADRNPPLVIGGAYGRTAAGTASGCYSGWVDDVQIYDRVLSESQINALFLNPGRDVPELASALSIAPAGGDFVGSVEVTLSSTLTGPKIRYTLDGSDPSATSALYAAPFTLSEPATVKARLFVNEYPVSEVVSATFSKIPGISFNPTGGFFTNQVEVGLVNNLGFGSLLYTTDGSEPTVSSPIYTMPVVLTAAGQVKARVFVGGFPASEVCAATYTRVYAVDDGIPGSWREQHFGPGYLTDPRVAADADPDGDGWRNLIEYQNNTDPLDKESHPEIYAGIRAIPLVSWNSVPGLSYRVLRKSNLNATNWDIALPAFSATHTNSIYIDPDATTTSVYQIELLP